MHLDDNPVSNFCRTWLKHRNGKTIDDQFEEDDKEYRTMIDDIDDLLSGRDTRNDDKKPRTLIDEINDEIKRMSSHTDDKHRCGCGKAEDDFGGARMDIDSDDELSGGYTEEEDFGGARMDIDTADELRRPDTEDGHVKMDGMDVDDCFDDFEEGYDAMDLDHEDDPMMVDDEDAWRRAIGYLGSFWSGDCHSFPPEDAARAQGFLMRAVGYVVILGHCMHDKRVLFA